MAIELKSNGIDVFYIDESAGNGLFIVTAVQVPFLRFSDGGVVYVWDDYHERARLWRKAISDECSILKRPELHASKLLRRKGLLHRAGRSLTEGEALETYAYALENVGFLGPASIMTTYATRQSNLYGARTIEAAIVGLLQRIRKKCSRDRVHGLIFFDEGHHEYIRFFRRASKYLPTGSKFGAWWGGKSTTNMPLDMFLKDANLKGSKFSLFVQIADLVCYAALLKFLSEKGLLPADRIALKHHLLYDTLSDGVVNRKATYRRKDGIVQI